jgi:glycosyltransferase involved in cell wall biosynthesis
MHEGGKIVDTECREYTLNDGVRVIRMAVDKTPHPLLTMLTSHMSVYDKLVELKPDFIFYHGLVSTTIYDVVRYKKKINPDCVIVQDNHLDYNIGRVCKGIRSYVVRAHYRLIHRMTRRYISRVYGVTPWRKTYAEDYFAVSPDKTDVLIMGADDEKIDFANREAIRQALRAQYGVGEGEFLVVTGGKIDQKKKIHLLMKACGELEGVKLLVFGNVNENIKAEFDALLEKHPNIIYIGWIDADRVYDYFFAADLVAFPGQHSVLWEQACACKVPCLFEKWEGMDHVNNGGNSSFVSPVTADTLKECIEELKFTEKHAQMKRVAASDATDIYLYSKIAEKSLECAR